MRKALLHPPFPSAPRTTLAASLRAVVHGKLTLFEAVYSYVLQTLGDKVELVPGAEFRAAAREAEAQGAKVSAPALVALGCARVGREACNPTLAFIMDPHATGHAMRHAGRVRVSISVRARLGLGLGLGLWCMHACKHGALSSP
jgi:hypothetical protein